MQAIRLGLYGLGTVGGAVFDVLARNGDEIARRAGRRLEVTVLGLRRERPELDPRGARIERDLLALAAAEDVDVIVELVGGTTVARELVLRAIAAGKHVVTANKALIAEHGNEIFAAAEAHGVSVAFEAAVAGGIPLIKAIREGLAANRIGWLAGIVNGTSNFVLSEMRATGRDFEDVLAEAQRLGYAEADPTFDVDGTDAAHKLTLLAAIAYGTKPHFETITREGIGSITIEDIRRAGDMGYKIKLLGVAQMTGRGLEQRMSPCLVPATSPLGQLEGGTNMVVIEGDSVGQIVLRGAGAGEGPTASAVMSDVCDIARGIRLSTFGQPAAALDDAPPASAASPARYYLRMELADKPGALAKVATALGEAGVSIDRMRQYDHPGDNAPVLIVTHKAARPDLDTALGALPATGVLVGDPVALRIEDV